MSDGQRGGRSNGSCCRKRAGMGPSHGKWPVQMCRWPRRDGSRCIHDSGSKGFGEQRGKSHPQIGALAVS